MNISRRNAVLGAGAALALGQTAWARPRSAMVRLGAQTNAWPIDTKDLNSFLDVLRQIKRTGYEGFETGYFNLVQHLPHIAEVREQIQTSGLRFFGMHLAVGADRCDPKTHLPSPSFYEPLAIAAKDLGAEYWILSSIPVKNAGEIDGKAEGLRRAAAYSQSIQLPLLYHNHRWEFANQGTEMDVLFESTDDTPLRFLLDAGHAFHAGADIPALLRKRSRRIAALHLRDFNDDKQVPLGQGNFPLAQVATVLRQTGWSGWALNEEDSDGKQKLGTAVIVPAYQALEAAFRS